MDLLVIFTSEESKTETILKILLDKGVERGVVIESQGMKKILGFSLSPGELFSIFADRSPINKTVMAIADKKNIDDIVQSINNFWKADKDKEKNRVIFSVPINNLMMSS